MERAVALMRAAAAGGYRLAQSWLENNENRYCSIDGGVKAKWKKKPEPANDSLNLQKDTAKPQDNKASSGIKPNEDDSIEADESNEEKHQITDELREKYKDYLDEPICYEYIYNGVIERDPLAFGALMKLGEFEDPIACYYLGLFLERESTNVMSLLYAGKWLDKGLVLGNRDCSEKSRAVAKRIDEIDNTCPFCSSHLKEIPGRGGGHFMGCSNYPECKYTRTVKLTSYVLLDGVFYPEMRVGNALGKGYIDEWDIFKDYVKFGHRKDKKSLPKPPLERGRRAP